MMKEVVKKEKHQEELVGLEAFLSGTIKSLGVFNT